VSFEDPLQRVVFEEIRGMGSIDSRRLRALLPARVTNRGFPDFDLDEFLAPHEVTEKEIGHSLRVHCSFSIAAIRDEERRAGLAIRWNPVLFDS